MKSLWMIAAVVAAAILVGAGGMVLAQRATDSPDSASTANPGSVSVTIPNQQVGIWVNGEGKVTLTPDLATIQLGVEAQAGSVSEAQKQASDAMDKLVKSLTSNGIASKDIQTRFFSVTRVTRWDDKTQTEVITGYRVSNSVTVKIRTLDRVGTIIDDVSEAGGDLTRINGISFSVEDPTAARAQARNKAMADAKAKAEQLAKQGGVKLGSPTYINESSSAPFQSVPYSVMAADSKAAGAAATPVSAGEMDITVNVQVTYAIQ
jgi:uncharacterized protein